MLELLTKIRAALGRFMGRRRMFEVACLTLGVSLSGGNDCSASLSAFDSYQWNEVNAAASWAPRAGLEVVALNDTLYLMGGRTPIDPAIVPVFGASTIWGDVWQSTDSGRTWNEILPTGTPGHWAGRAYFEAVTKGDTSSAALLVLATLAVLPSYRFGRSY
jgi:hypothetical protein